MNLYTRYFFGIFLFAVSAYGQTTVNQIIISNGEIFETSPPYLNRANIGTYNPSNGTYTVFDTMHVESVQDVLVDGNTAYATAGDSIYKYDIDNYTRTASVASSGSNKLAVYNNYLLVTRGFGSTGHYFEVRNKSDLSLVDQVDSISEQAAGITVVNDKAYIAVPGNFGSTTGKIAIYDLTGLNFVKYIALDTLGVLVGPLFNDGHYVYSINAIGFGSSYGAITKYDTQQDTFITKRYDVSINGGTALHNGILYVKFGDGIGNFKIGTFNPQTMSIIDTTLVDGNVVASVLDTVNNLFYTTNTDYFSFGKASIYSISGLLSDTFTTGISPEAMDIDYRTISYISESQEVSSLKMFPNPNQGDILYFNKPLSNIELLDVTGKTFFKHIAQGEDYIDKISLEYIPDGIYLVRVLGTTNISTQKIVITR